MASLIDPTKPVDAVPALKVDLRANLQAAKDEIEALQNGKLAAPVANADLADVDESTIKGRISSNSGRPEDLTPEQARLVLELGALAQKSQVAVPGDLAASGTPDGTTFLRGDGQWSVPAGGTGGTVPEPAIVTIGGASHTLGKAEGMHQNVMLLVDNNNQDCVITLPDSDANSSAGVAWALMSRTTGTVTVQRETNGTINGVGAVQMVGPGRSGMLLVESNPGLAPAARFEGETTETMVLDGDFDAAGRQVRNAVMPLADSEIITSRDLALADAGQKMLRVNSASPVTLAVREDSAVDFPLGTVLNIARWGEGEAIIAPGSGVTLKKASDQGRKIRQNDVVGLWKQAANTWLLFGGLEQGGDPPGVIGTPTEHTAGSGGLGPTSQFTHTVAAGTESLIVIAGGGWASGTPGMTVSSDVDGNLSNEVAPPTGVGTAQPSAGVWYIANPTAGAHTITLTTTGPDFEYVFAVALDLENVDGATPFGASDSTLLASGVGASGRSITTEQDSSLLLTVYAIQGGDQAPVTPDSGLAVVHDGVTGPAGTFDCTYSVAQKTVETAGSADYGFTPGSGSDEQVVIALEVRRA